MNIERIECPNCRTSYHVDRIGINNLRADQRADITISCPICHTQFDAIMAPKLKTEQLGWFSRVVLRRVPTTESDGHEVTTKTRK